MKTYGKFRALDVREFMELRSLSGSGSSYSTRMHISTELKVVVIANRVSDNERCRIVFTRPDTGTFLGDTKYYGYEGPWEMIVPGDVFEVEETNTYDKVTILEEE